MTTDTVHAPNGATYTVVPDGPSVWIKHPDHEPRRVVAGYDGNRFESLDRVWLFVFSDGRSTYAPGLPLFQRPFVGSWDSESERAIYERIHDQH